MSRTKKVHVRLLGEEMQVAIPVFSERYKRRGTILHGKTKAALVFKTKGQRVVLPLIKKKVTDNPKMAEDYGFLMMNIYLDENEVVDYPELDVIPKRLHTQ